jgi:Dirigent-like protein
VRRDRIREVPTTSVEVLMRRVAVLSACAVVGGALLVPATALAADDDGSGHDGRDVTWLAEEELFAVVLPDGEEFTEDSPPPEGVEEEEDFTLPVGSQLFVGEVLYATEDGVTRGDEVGRTHIECVSQIAPDTFSCDIVFVLDEGSSQLHGSVLVTFTEAEASQPESFDIAVTGGTGEFFDAGGAVTLTDTTDEEDPEAVTTTLYEADLD